jgi:hypothetical protein
MPQNAMRVQPVLKFSGNAAHRQNAEARLGREKFKFHLFVTQLR